ncbi:MAG: GNAT family N-acetyltransferase [Candidatus Pacebacteria bacterium]|nr:GNAT family N-acetyltransferase [Candidatus Paceibacterota bacterium]
MKVKLRKADSSDIEFLWHLRNQPEVFKFFKNPKPVAFQEHLAWIMPILEGVSSKELFVIEVEGKQAGQVRMDIEGEEAQISVSLLPKFQGKGIAYVALKMMVEKMKKKKKIKILQAEIHQDNIASQKLFARLGFCLHKQEGEWQKYQYES